MLGTQQFGGEEEFSKKWEIYCKEFGVGIRGHSTIKGGWVNFLGLYDPVDMDISINWIDRNAKIPNNVEMAYVAFRSNGVGSRPSFNNVGTSAEAGDPCNIFARKEFYGTHSALGGAPWKGDHPSFHTEQLDIEASRLVETWMNYGAKSAGITLGDEIQVKKHLPKPGILDRTRSGLYQLFDWRTYARMLGGSGGFGGGWF